MISLNPKKSFQENEDASRSFRAIVDSHHFIFAVNQAVSEFSLNHAPTADELRGMRSFLNIFLNLAEPETEMPTFPTRRLEIITDTRKPSPSK